LGIVLLIVLVASSIFSPLDKDTLKK